MAILIFITLVVCTVFGFIAGYVQGSDKNIGAALLLCLLTITIISIVTSKMYGREDHMERNGTKPDTTISIIGGVRDTTISYSIIYN